MINVLKELQAFNNIKFDDAKHKYYNEKQEELKSTTNFISRFYNKYNEEFWSIYKSLQENGFTCKAKEPDNSIIVDNSLLTIPEILQNKDIYFKKSVPADFVSKWKTKGGSSSNLGTNLHNYIENFYNNKLFFPTGLTRDERYRIGLSQFHAFHEKSKESLIPIKNEMVIGDSDIMIGGMVDALFYNSKCDQYQIYDWKTNEELKTDNRFQNLKSIFKHLPDCHLSHYSIQLSIYKKIIEKNTGIKIGDCYLVGLNGMQENNFRLFKIYDLDKEMEALYNKTAQVIRDKKLEEIKKSVL